MTGSVWLATVRFPRRTRNVTVVPAPLRAWPVSDAAIVSVALREAIFAANAGFRCGRPPAQRSER
jgi:hypothetical protein